MHWFFILLFFFEFLCPFESWSNPMFDHDLYKFKTWIWKIKHVSFVVTPKWSSILRRFLKFPCLKPKNHVLLFMLDFISQRLGLVVAWCINFLVWICLDIVYQNLIECLLDDISVFEISMLVIHKPLLFMHAWLHKVEFRVWG